MPDTAEINQLPPEAPRSQAEIKAERIVIASFLGSAVLGAGIGFAVAHESSIVDEQEKNQNDLVTAARYERCADYITHNLKPGDTSITIKLNSLNKETQRDCNITDLATTANGIKGAEPNTQGPKARITSVDASIKLPSAAKYMEAALGKRKSAKTNNDLLVNLQSVGGVAIGFLGGPVTLMLGVTGYFKLKSMKQPRNS